MMYPFLSLCRISPIGYDPSFSLGFSTSQEFSISIMLSLIKFVVLVHVGVFL
jgi:hypothetical protein